MTFRQSLLLPTIAFALAGAAAQTLAAPIVYSDQTFNLADYTSLSYQQVPVLTAFVQTASGNPGTAVETTYSTSGDVNVVAGLFRADFSYDPMSSGALGSISVSLDRYFRPFQNGAEAGVSVFTLRTFIVQGGQYYQAVQTFPGLPPGGSDQWVSLSAAGLTAADFGLFDFTTGVLNASTNPDFNQAMSFGFGMRATDLSATTKSGTLRADNWFLTLNPARSVPEPGTLSLLGLGALGLGFARRPKGIKGRE